MNIISFSVGMISTQSLKNDFLLLPTLYDGMKIIATNLYGGYDISDPIDAVAANAEIIITIIAEKIASRTLEFAVPRFNPIRRIGNSKNAALFYISAGVLSSALATTVIYPIQIFRTHRKIERSIENSTNSHTVAVIEIDTKKEEKATILGGFLCFVVNSIPASFDLAINYAKGHNKKLALFVIASSIAIVNSSITGRYRKLIRKMIPESLP